MSSGMQQRLNVGRRHRKALRIDAENLVLAFVPHPVAIDPVPVPGPHLAGGDREAAALLAFEQPGVRFLQLGGAGANAIFKLGIEPLELTGLAIQLGEHLDLGAQHFRNHRHRNVVDRAHLVAAQPVDIADLDGGDEDHRRLLEARMLADHGGELETVQLRHADVDQDDRDFVLEQVFQRLAAGRGDDEVFVELLQDHFIGEQLGRLIVDQQDVDLFVVCHWLVHQRCSHMRMASSNCSVLTGLAR